MNYLIFFISLLFNCLLFGQNIVSVTSKYYEGVYILAENSQRQFPTFYQFNISSKKNTNGSTHVEVIAIFSQDTLPAKSISAKIYKIKSFLTTRDSVQFDSGSLSKTRFVFSGKYDKISELNKRDIPFLKGELKYYKDRRLIKKVIVVFDGSVGC